MEKASEVYNKLKLRFVGKPEVAAKPQTEDKEPENNEKETQNTGKKLQLVSCLHLDIKILFVFVLISSKFCIF